MEKLKKGFIFLSTVGLAATLSACNDNKDTKEDKSENKTETKSENKSTDSKTATSNDKEDNKVENDSKEVDVNQLTEKTKLALAFFADDVDQYILTKDEALTGVFETNYGGKKEKKQLYKLLLIKTNNVANAPKGMNFYQVYPAKGSFASVIGVSKDKVFVGGTQGAFDYKQMQDTSKEYNIKDLYNQNKSYSSLSELAKKIQITDKNPMEDDKTREKFEANENPGTNTHMRTQVYTMIEELDGQPIDTDKYLVDNVQMDDNGKWYVHYRNKNAEIVGTYTTKDGKVVKKDADGNIIKEKKVNPNN
ncbi:hypothetical protein BUZ11_13665 [Staphylococcus gallinarum]|uniref:hypothetical protein n=3 Tax=Staphylococcus gallinarum TaxID=1293 RepID=UPI000D1FAFC1|nr:hypothetical protein [Staphylococcus gallinarum]PTL07588.1 hypothetical protein BUZ09_08140 [Staphylococcus gallinarum]PTL10491.1 hypothetical protein BUZ15_07060 [Staphylococcus gallinarum]RIL28249.1 hypothetical protein BUY98_13850 [Staphylococcus gallinarum]RIO73549.1 hypothetical protein BUZ12_13745 [Staphylococcus gallinarum]RIO79791.1 hypothetical protein BUZ11_13665 [Staphylococcus gallinarum]